MPTKNRKNEVNKTMFCIETFSTTGAETKDLADYDTNFAKILDVPKGIQRVLLRIGVWVNDANFLRLVIYKGAEIKTVIDDAFGTAIDISEMAKLNIPYSGEKIPIEITGDGAITNLTVALEFMDKPLY